MDVPGKESSGKESLLTIRSGNGATGAVGAAGTPGRGQEGGLGGCHWYHYVTIMDVPGVELHDYIQPRNGEVTTLFHQMTLKIKFLVFGVERTINFIMGRDSCGTELGADNEAQMEFLQTVM